MPVSVQYILQQGKLLNKNLSLKEAGLLASYLDLLLSWNRKYNLIGTQDKTRAFHHLLADSLFLADILKAMPWTKHPTVLDIGAGAGIPGIPLRILWSQGTYLMLEPRQKRAAFIHYCLAKLELKDTTVLDQRLEEIRQEKETCYDLILSRGVWGWDNFLPRVGPVINKSSGQALVFSNQPWKKASSKCPTGWLLKCETDYELINRTKRYFWFFCPKS